MKSHGRYFVLITNKYKTYSIWDRFKRAILYQFKSMDTQIVSFSVSQHFVALGMENGMIVVHQLEDGNQVYRLFAARSSIKELYLFESKQSLAIYFEDDTQWKTIQFEASFNDPPSTRWKAKIYYCSCCGKREQKLFTCGNCKSVGYCSLECQKASWINHQSVCFLDGPTTN